MLNDKLFVLFQDLEEIGNSMKKYHCMLERKNEKISANQMSLNLPRSPFTDFGKVPEIVPGEV